MTATLVGQNVAPSGTTNNIALTQAVPAGQTLVIGMRVQGTITSVNDAGTNTYVSRTVHTNSNGHTAVQFFDCIGLATGVANGSNITVVSSVQPQGLWAILLPNALANIFAGNSGNSTGTSSALSSGVLSTQPATAIWLIDWRFALTSFTDDTSWSGLYSNIATAPLTVLETKDVTSTASIGWTGTFAQSGSTEYQSGLVVYSTTTVVAPPPFSSFSRQQYLHI